MMSNIVKALENLQEKVCNIEDTIASSKEKKSRPTNDTEVSQPTNNGGVNIIRPPGNMSYSDATRDPNAPPAIILYQPDGNNASNATQNVNEQHRPEVTLEGRTLLPRPQTAPELLEKREKERRKYNIVIQNLAESNSDSAEDRKSYDIMEVRCMLVAMRLRDIEVKAAVRMGKKTENKSRPLMITLDSDRDQVVKKARFIRRYDCWRSVFIDPDRTPQEQEIFKETRLEFKRRKESGENVIMRDGKILKSSRRASYLDLEALVTQAQEQATALTGDAEHVIDRIPSVNLINLSDSVSNVQTPLQSEGTEQGASTSQTNSDEPVNEPQNDATQTPVVNPESSGH